MRSERNKPGLTLIELLVVTAIIAGLAALATPAFVEASPSNSKLETPFEFDSNRAAAPLQVNESLAAQPDQK